MLIAHVERYIAVRRIAGYKLRDTARQLMAFARFADELGDSHVRVVSAVSWAAKAPSPNARHIWLRSVIKLARFLHAEDPVHEVPSRSPFPRSRHRPPPYIYTAEEIGRIVATAGLLDGIYPLGRQVYATLFGLVASTGLRVSEALDLRLDDVLPEGVLRIRHSKFLKSRLVPLHPTAWEAVRCYLERRGQTAVSDDHVFLSAGGRRIHASMVNYTFRKILRMAKIGKDLSRMPRIHDLRHTFATRALEACPSDRRAIARHFVALSTYLGHVDASTTYWYLEATPHLMTDVASAAERMMWEEA
jgi:integrase/recombinase XerD